MSNSDAVIAPLLWHVRENLQRQLLTNLLLNLDKDDHDLGHSKSEPTLG